MDKFETLIELAVISAQIERLDTIKNCLKSNLKKDLPIKYGIMYFELKQYECELMKGLSVSDIIDFGFAPDSLSELL